MYRLRLPHLGTYSLRRLVAAVAVLAVLAAALAVSGLLGEGKATPGDGKLGRAADWTPSYASDVAPIFARACIRCHGSQRADKGLRLDSYQRMMAGDSYGTVVIPGDSSLSALVSVAKYGTMPHGGTKLTDTELATISRWIDIGAPEN